MTDQRFEEAAENYADSQEIRGSSFHQGLRRGFLAGCEHAAPKTAQDILKDLEEQMETIKPMKYFSDQFKEGYAGAIHDMKVLMRERFSSPPSIQKLNPEKK